MPRRPPHADPCPERGYLAVPEAAAYLGLTERALRRRVERSQVPFRRWQGRLVFSVQDLDTFLAALDGCTVQQALDHLGVEP